MSIDLVWEEPPAASSRDTSAVGLAVETLKKHPGRWAKVEEGSTSTTAAAKWRKRGCEAVHRSRLLDGDAKTRKYVYDVYARWPEPEPEPPTPEEVARQKARTATPQELAKAYAEKKGTSAEEVDQAWRNRPRPRAREPEVTPARLFLDCRDRPDLRPAEHRHLEGVPGPVVALAPARLAAEIKRRSLMVDRIVRAGDRLRAAAFSLRHFDETGHADLALDHLAALRDEIVDGVNALVDDVENAYERHEQHVLATLAGRDPRGPVSEPLPEPEPAHEPIAPEPAKSVPPAAPDELEEAAAAKGPSPADVARLLPRRS